MLWGMLSSCSLCSSLSPSTNTHTHTQTKNQVVLHGHTMCGCEGARSPGPLCRYRTSEGHYSLQKGRKEGLALLSLSEMHQAVWLLTARKVLWAAKSNKYPWAREILPQVADMFPWQTATGALFFHCPFPEHTAQREGQKRKTTRHMVKENHQQMRRSSTTHTCCTLSGILYSIIRYLPLVDQSNNKWYVLIGDFGELSEAIFPLQSRTKPLPNSTNLLINRAPTNQWNKNLCQAWHDTWNFVPASSWPL